MTPSQYDGALAEQVWKALTPTVAEHGVRIDDHDGLLEDIRTSLRDIRTNQATSNAAFRWTPAVKAAVIAPTITGVITLLAILLTRAL